MEADGAVRATVQFRGTVQTPYLGLRWPFGQLAIGRDEITVRVRWFPRRWSRTVRADERPDIRIVTELGMTGIGFVRGGLLRGWILWSISPTPVVDALAEGGWLVGPRVSFDDFKTLAW